MSFEQNEEIIVITADEAGEWKKEKVSVAGIRRMISERFSPDYREQMNTLREVDSQIRAWARSIRDNVKELKNAFKSGRIIDVAILFARFNKHLETVVDIGKDVEIFYEKSLAEFESGHELTDYSELEGLGNKEATLLGDLARKYISKRIYNREIKERNMAVRRLISKAEAVYKTIDTYLDGMKAAKKDGDIGRYVDFLRKISAKQKDFESAFIPTYNRYLKRSVELAMEHDKSKPEKGGLKGEGPVPNIFIDQSKETAAPVVAPEHPPITQPHEGTPFAATVEVPAMFEQKIPEIGVESAKPEPPTAVTKTPQRLPPVEKIEPEPDTEDDNAPETLRSAKLEDDNMFKVANVEFIKELQKLADEYADPNLIAIALLKYAEAMEDEDLDTSLKLMALAEGVLNG